MGQAELQRAGPRPDLSSIYHDEVAYVWDFLRYLGIPARDIEDVVHDTFLTVHRRLDTYDPSRPLRPWITGIAYRVASDYRRRARHRHEVMTDHAAASANSDPEQATRRRRARDVLLRVLEEMSPERRAVFFLHEMEERSVVEIAEMLDVPINTLYSRLRRARQQFERAVDRHRRSGKGGAR